MSLDEEVKRLDPAQYVPIPAPDSIEAERIYEMAIGIGNSPTRLPSTRRSDRRTIGRARYLDRPLARRVTVVLAAAVILAVFFAPLPHLSLFDRLSRGQSASSTSAPSTVPRSTVAPSTTSGSTTVPSTTQPHATSDKIVTVAQLPKGFMFDPCVSPPVLSGSRHEVFALVERPTSSNCPPSALTLARIELPSGHVVLGPSVAGIASLFTGPTGQLFLLNLSGGRIGHIEVWRVSDNLTPMRLVRLPFTEKMAVEWSYTDPAIAVAVVPAKNEAWVADGQHIDLVNLSNGDLIATRSAPRGIAGNVAGLAMASTSGPLYMTFCERRPGSPANDPFLGCGVIGEINPATWTVTSKRWYGGPVSFGRYGIVATLEGAWLSEGGGGNGVGIKFYSSAGLRPAQSSWSSNALASALGQIDLFASGNVVWSLSSGGELSCLSASPSGSVRGTAVVTGGTSRVLGGGPGGIPFGIESPRHRLLAVAGYAASVVAVQIPRACATGSGR